MGCLCRRSAQMTVWDKMCCLMTSHSSATETMRVHCNSTLVDLTNIAWFSWCLLCTSCLLRLFEHALMSNWWYSSDSLHQNGLFYLCLGNIWLRPKPARVPSIHNLTSRRHTRGCNPICPIAQRYALYSNGCEPLCNCHGVATISPATALTHMYRTVSSWQVSTTRTYRSETLCRCVVVEVWMNLTLCCSVMR